MKIIDDPDLVLLDATPDSTIVINHFSNYSGFIPGTRKFDVKNVFSDNSAFPNMMLDADEFGKRCRDIGINRESKIVVYDKMGIYMSPRVRWMFKAMGHDTISVLDGGLDSWLSIGGSVSNIVEDLYCEGDFVPMIDASLVVDKGFVGEMIDNSSYLIVDARAEGRFNGSVNEPRAGLRSGHIPSSVNLPYQSVLTDEGKIKSVDELKLIFSTLPIHDILNENQDEKHLIFTCGSGVTACILDIASELVNSNQRSVYDGSWSEWGKS